MNQEFRSFFESAKNIVLGKEEELALCLAALLSEGHVLLEDLPGRGKTTLSLFFAKALALNFNRIQGTIDLLPADVLGGRILNGGELVLEKGPIFTSLLLVDEINRAGPKTQSAFLQAMEERQVSLEGTTIDLPEPFFVMATQNPREQIGTYPLPESQLDRFMIRMEMGLLEENDEINLLTQGDRRSQISYMPHQMKREEILKHMDQSKEIYCSDNLIQYVYSLLKASRESDNFQGLSPRSGLDIIRLSRAWAYIKGSKQVEPEFIQFLLPFVFNHRIGQNILTVEKSFEKCLELMEMVELA